MNVTQFHSLEEHGSKVSNKVNHTEDDATDGSHGQVTSTSIILHRMGLHKLGEEVVHGLRRADLGRSAVDGESEDHDDNEEDGGVGVVAQESSAHASDDDVDGYTDGDEEACRDGVHAGQVGDSRGSTYVETIVVSIFSYASHILQPRTECQHGRDEYIRRQSKEQEHHMADFPEPDINDLQERMSVRRVQLQLGSQLGEEQDLHRCTRGVPVGTGDAITIRDGGRLEKGCGPRPGGNDTGGDEAR